MQTHQVDGLRCGSNCEKNGIFMKIFKDSLIINLPLEIQHVAAGIISLGIILCEILNVKVETYANSVLNGQ